MQQHLLLKLLDNGLAVAFVGLLQVARDVIHLATVGQRHHDALVEVALGFINLLDDGACHLAYMLCLAVEGLHHLLEGILLQFLALYGQELFVGERNLHSKDVEELLLAALVIVLLDDVDHAVPHHVRDIHADALTHQGMAALLVYNGALLVHHVIIFQQALTNTEVVLLDLLLGALYLFRYHRTLNHLALLESKAVHDIGNTLGTEQAHQLIFQRNEEQRGTWVALTTGTTTQLAVNTARLMALGTDDGQTTSGFYFRRKLDISTTTSHVGSDGHGTLAVGRLTGQGHDVGLLLV